MFGTGSCRQPPPAFQACSATANIAICTHRGSSSRPKRLSRSTASCASTGASPSSSARIRHSIENASTRKWPEPQHGSITVTSATRVRPAVEGARGRRAVVVEAQVVEALDERAVRVAGCPPGAEGVLQQEPDHVVLGEQLGDRAEVGAADLALGGVDLVLLVLLPELVHPAERVVGGEDLRRQAGEDLLEREATFRREPQPDARIVEPEDARAGSRRRTGPRPTSRRARPARRPAPRSRRA